MVIIFKLIYHFIIYEKDKVSHRAALSTLYFSVLFFVRVLSIIEISSIVEPGFLITQKLQVHNRKS